MKKVLLKLTTAFVLVTILIFAYSKSNEKNNSITYVAGTNDKVRYIKAKDCPEEAYESKNSNDYFYNMCKAYTTDGVSVYYDGMREMLPPTIVAPVMINGRYSSSSMPTYTPSKPGPILIEGADPKTFEIISTDYLDDSLDPKQNPTLTYARDKNFLYRVGEKVVDADPDTLIILGNGYIKDKNSVYSRGKKIEGSDSKTFEFLKYGYARDKNFVYLVWQNKKIENSDGKSFEILNEDYARDSDAVYYKQKKLEGADSNTFEIIYPANVRKHISPSGYAKDKNFLYFQGARIDGADPATFEIVEYGIQGIQARDKNFVYGAMAKKLTWIDAGTFKIVSSGYYKDKNAVYYGEGKIIDNADPATFEYLGGIYSKDKNYVWRSYFVDEGGMIGSVSRIKNADPDTFQFLTYEYARDKNFVWHQGDILPNATAKSFTTITQEYSKDDNSVYFIKEKIMNADPDTFEVIDYTYTKDKNSAYYRGKKIEGVDPVSFGILSCGYAKDKSKVFKVNYDGVINVLDVSDISSFKVFEGNCYAKDKNFVYFYNYDGVRIEGADPKTFEIIDSWYTKDLTSVYYMGARIQDANPKTFMVMKGDYAKDKKSVYYMGKRIENADPDSFELSSYGTDAHDKNSSYLFGKAIKTGDVMIEANMPTGAIPPPGIQDAIIVKPYPLGL